MCHFYTRYFALNNCNNDDDVDTAGVAVSAVEELEADDAAMSE